MLTQPLLNRLCRQATPQITLDRGRCLRSRFNKNSCTLCLQGCASGALSLGDTGLRHDAQKCTDCMQCVAACPNDALSGPVNFLALLDEVAAKTSVRLSCQKGLLGPDQIRIPCVGMFSEALLAAVNAVTQQECSLDVSGCADCVNSHCLPILEKMMAGLATRLPNQGKIRLKYHLNQQPPQPCSDNNERRSLLRLFGKNITALSKEALSVTEPCPAPQTPGHGKKQPHTTAALQQALAVLEGRRNHERAPLLSYFFSAATTAQCDICPLCTGMCPTGALQRQKGGGRTALTFTSARCSGCGLCAGFCKKNALTIRAGFPGDPTAPQQLATR